MNDMASFLFLYQQKRKHEHFNIFPLSIVGKLKRVSCDIWILPWILHTNSVNFHFILLAILYTFTCYNAWMSWRRDVRVTWFRRRGLKCIEFRMMPVWEASNSISNIRVHGISKPNKKFANYTQIDAFPCKLNWLKLHYLQLTPGFFLQYN